ncbi:MAG TPA: hypothetical protein VEA19_05815 [Actinomycetota bacterium]|nr:hypothetical protein [Actinomycetota bacterium]
MIEPVLALTRTNIEGVLVTIASLILFVGSIYVLVAAVFGSRMGYLISATSFFGFMMILSALWAFGSWAFGAPGTPRYLGPKGDLPAWVALGAGQSLESSSYPVIEQYPGGPWQDPRQAGANAEVEPVRLAFGEFLAEEANAELRERQVEGEVASTEFRIEDIRFTNVDGTELATARAFATGGGPQVIVTGYKDPGDEGMPSFAFLIASVLGFAIHLPFLDRAERRRKEILTGGEQPAWRGPA